MQILKIRWYQIKRDLGILVFPIVAGLFGLSFFAFNHEKQIGHYVAMAIVYLFYHFHKTRTDIPFAEKHFVHPKQQFIFEYQLAALPITSACLFSSYWYSFFLIHLVLFGIPFITIKALKPAKFMLISKWLKTDFVFISGIRKHFFSLLILIIVSFILSFVKMFPLVTLFLVNSIMYSFYDTNESVQLLQSSKATPKQLLNQVFWSGAIKLIAINVPVLFINTLFHFDLLFFNVFFLGYSLLLLSTVISLKYASYTYHSGSTKFQVKLIIMSLGLMMPYLLPISILFYYQSKTDAVKNLKIYLDDFN